MQLTLPGVTIAYFLIGFPRTSYGFYLLVTYTIALTAESLLLLVTKFTKNAAYAFIAAQALLVMFTVYAGVCVCVSRSPAWRIVNTAPLLVLLNCTIVYCTVTCYAPTCCAYYTT
jgi:hypothetical protein